MRHDLPRRHPRYVDPLLAGGRRHRSRQGRLDHRRAAAADGGQHEGRQHGRLLRRRAVERPARQPGHRLHRLHDRRNLEEPSREVARHARRLGRQESQGRHGRADGRMEAQQWCDKMENKDEMATIIGKRQWFNVPPADIINRIKGDINYGDGRKVTGSDLTDEVLEGRRLLSLPEPRAVVPHREPALGQAAADLDTKAIIGKVNREDLWRDGRQEHQRRRGRHPQDARRAARKPSSTARCSIPRIRRPISPACRSRRWS